MNDPFRLGQHDAQLQSLDIRVGRIEASLEDVNTKLDTVLMALAERRGERKMIATIAALAGGLGSFVMSFIFKVWEK